MQSQILEEKSPHASGGDLQCVWLESIDYLLSSPIKYGSRQNFERQLRLYERVKPETLRFFLVPLDAHSGKETGYSCQPQQQYPEVLDQSTDK